MLVVEDEENVRFVIVAALRQGEFVVQEAVEGREALRIVADPVAAPDLVVLDVMLPDLDGFEVCRRMRADGIDVPVVFLTARDATADRLRGLTIGGDDYLTKPFSIEELVARVQVILRRVGKARRARVLSAGDLELDDDAHVVRKAGVEVALSHELRTPVAAIGGFADLWRQGALAPGQLDDVMRRIGQESARMRGLVEDLLLLARLDEGRALALEPIDLAALAADAVLDASATHPSRGVRLHAPAPVVVEGDEARLRQVVANLVSNALVHTGPATTVEVRAERQGSVALLGVSDHGPGMTPEAAARAFDRFWRADPSRARSGAGLGLPIVRGIVAAHHGDVRLDTAPGAGTTVQVVLPAAAESAPTEPAGPANGSQETRKRRSGVP